MTTTENKPRGNVGGAEVVDEAARRRHLEHLLELRAQLAEAAGAHRAHDLPDAAALTRQQHGVEQLISEGWPEVYANRWPAWVREDARLLHTTGTLISDCAVCVALARQAGVNIEPPEAA